MFNNRKNLIILFVLTVILTTIIVSHQQKNVHANLESASNVVVSVEGGDYHYCAITHNDKLFCWGDNISGQLGNGTFNDSSIPVEVINLDSGVVSVSAGQYTTCAISVDKTVKCWGAYSYPSVPIPTTIDGLNDILLISVGYNHFCAITTFGNVKCMGQNDYGQLGDGSTNAAYSPVDVVGISDAISISAGRYSTCALTQQKTVKCWGYNEFGQLGNGNNNTSYSPVNVTGLNSDITLISAARDHTCALSTTGSVQCWGINTLGQLGNGSNINSNTPVDILNPYSDAIYLSSWLNHSCLTTTTGSVKCWGDNSIGALGNGTYVNSNVPVDVVQLNSNVLSTSNGNHSTCALTNTGSLKCWGNSFDGQLGSGFRGISNTPVDVIGFTGVPCDQLTDTDGDAIPDGWEVCGFDYNGDGIIDVDLPAMGANWLHKDVFLEIDYMVLRPFRNFHPSDKTIEIMVDAYNNSPVQNPDGTSGIHLHADYGKNSPLTWGTAPTWDSLSRSDELPYSLFIFENGLWEDFFERMQFSNARKNIFHYAIFGELMAPSKLGAGGYSLGIESQHLAIALDIIYSPQEIGGITMHELGHNLGLRHGGNDDNNFKPNYLSIMNDSFTKSGLVINGQTGNYRYSEFTLETLDETSLDETIGITPVNQGDFGAYKSVYYCGNQMNLADIGSSVDWNCNGNETETNIATDINKSGIDILDSQNDWENLVFDGGCIGFIGSCEAPNMSAQQKVISAEELEFETFPDVYIPYRIEMSLGASYKINDDLETTVPITITNSGTTVSTINISYLSDSSIFELNNLPFEITLQSNESYVINVNVDTNEQEIDHEILKIFAVVQENNNWTGDTYIEIEKTNTMVYLPLVIK